MNNKVVFQVVMWDSNKEFRNYVVVTSELELAKVIVSNQYDKEVLGELNVYDEISQQPNRKNCALLPLRAVTKMLSELENAKDN